MRGAAVTAPKVAAPHEPRPSWAARGFVWLMLLPARLTWRFATVIERQLGIVLTLLLGGGLVFAGYVLSSTLLGIILGGPLFVLGAFILARAIW